MQYFIAMDQIKGHYLSLFQNLPKKKKKVTVDVLKKSTVQPH